MLGNITIDEYETAFFDADFFEKHTVVLYGAGIYGQLTEGMLRKRGYKPFAFCDSNPDKAGSRIAGLPVLNSAELGSIENLAVFITARHHAKDIETVLKRENILCIPFDRYIVLKDKTEYDKAYSLLSDDYSRKTFSAVLNTMLTGERKHLLETIEDNEFFCLPEFRFTEGCVFLDAGAYVGDTLEKFIWNCGGVFKKAFCFEPAVKPFQAMQKRVGRLKAEWNLGDEQIQCINAGLGEQNGNMNFLFLPEKPQTSSFMYAGIEAGTSTPLYTLDEFVMRLGVNLDFIKIDIEGYEMHMLRGAQKTIQKDKPKLAISVYHAPEHLYEIALYLKNLIPEYQFALRQHANILVATTLYVWI